ncbi:MAG: response regulator/pilus assembly protein [Clostridia bacterium]|jgi:pilus assembly protein CpaE|nr:response regulator/pilus assembly protein [Clostridia bacterium]
MELIRVLIVDDNDDTRRNICQMLSFDEQIVVVGEANDGVEAVQKAQDLQPNVVLMDINLPGLDGFSATEKITTDVPGTAVVVTSAQGEKEYLRKAMMVGARDFLVKPLRKEDLINTIKNVFKIENKRTGQNDIKKMPRKSEVITVFGTKGGVGKTTIAVNLAVYLAKCKQKVVLLDFDLQFGDISIFLNLYPRRTISELTQEGDAWDMELLESYLLPHISGVKALPAPSRPEYAELVMSGHIEEIINLLKDHYDYIVIDTSPFFNDTNLTALDLSTQILLVLAMDLATIKNVKLSLELLESLQHLNKTKLILNRASDDMGITIADAEETLNFLVAGHIPSEGKIVVPALNEGIPFVLSHPTAKVSKAIQEVGNLVLKDNGYQEDLRIKQNKNFFTRLFNRGD